MSRIGWQTASFSFIMSVERSLSEKRFGNSPLFVTNYPRDIKVGAHSAIHQGKIGCLHKVYSKLLL